MTKKKMGRPHVDYIMPIIEVKSVSIHVTHRIDDRWTPYRPGAGAWLQMRGTADEAIGGQSDVEISIHVLDLDGTGTPTPANSIGALIQLKPHAQVVLDLPPKVFDRVWTLAVGGQLRHIWLSMTKPKGRNAQVVSVSFQNEPIE